ncbi:MAG: hypothetical protein U5M23_12020 [Marinagarivorans sp.]|nr:hypothetical protein [Marinagarivorans sp.]
MALVFAAGIETMGQQLKVQLIGIVATLVFIVAVNVFVAEN